MRSMFAGLMLIVAPLGHTGASSVLNVAPTLPQFEVALPSNPTTGYQWTVSAFDKRLFRLVNSQYIPAQTTRIGAGGRMVFTFAPTKTKTYPASTQMQFTYARPWEPNSGTIKKLTIQFSKKP